MSFCCEFLPCGPPPGLGPRTDFLRTFINGLYLGSKKSPCIFSIQGLIGLTCSFASRLPQQVQSRILPCRIPPETGCYGPYLQGLPLFANNGLGACAPNVASAFSCCIALKQRTLIFCRARNPNYVLHVCFGYSPQQFFFTIPPG